MTKASDKRRDAVLRIIVDEYVATAAPVASEAILRHHRLGVSPATIRNDMAYLEEEGYIARPYSSSGGVPLDKAYRYYVENLSREVDLSQGEQKYIRRILATADAEYERILRLAANIIAQLAGNAAVVTYPKSSENKFRHLELVKIHRYMALIVLILSNAILRRAVLSFEEPVTQEQLDTVASKFNREYAGLTRQQIVEAKFEMTRLEEEITTMIVEMISQEDSLEYESSYLEGLRLMLGQPEFTQRDRMLRILEIMEVRGWLKPMIDWQAEDEGVKVIIGEENRETSLHDLSLVFGKYGVSSHLGGAVGIIGPKRMDYGRAISAVSYVSGVLSELVARVWTEG